MPGSTDALVRVSMMQKSRTHGCVRTAHCTIASESECNYIRISRAKRTREKPMIGYATLGTNNLARAQAFYDALLAEIGAKRLMELPHGFTMYGGRLDRPALAITPPYDGKEASAGNGNMLALVLDERAKVDALYKKALQLGGSDEGAPGVRGDEGPQAFYAAYFRDPEGNKLCAFRVGPA